MPRVLIAKIVSQTKLSIVQEKDGVIPTNQTLIEPTFLLSEVLKDYDNSTVKVRFKTFNSLNALKKEYKKSESKKKPLKLKEMEGVLSVEHGQRSTDIDDWFESSVCLNVFENIQRKRGIVKELNNKKLDFNEYLEGKENKIFYFEIS